MNLTQSRLYRPKDAEEAEELIDETRGFLEDSRVLDALLSATILKEQREGDSGTTLLLRHWRDLLPGQNSGDYRRFRIEYGWRARELKQIRDMVDLCGVTLKAMSQVDGLLSGTATTLHRDSQRLVPLWQKWDCLVNRIGVSV